MEQAIVTITSVRRISGNALLTLSTGEVLSMPRAMLKERPYKAGMPFDRAAHDTFMRERTYAFALEKSVSLLAARSRTEQEIAASLRRNAYPEQAIARVMARLHEAGYINDTDFAMQWVSSRTSKGMGSRRIRMELYRKGVDSDTIDAALSELNANDQLEGALQAARKAARGKQLTSPSDRQKILAALARRGYDFSMAKKALEYLFEQEY